MKRIIALFLAFSLILCISACDGADKVMERVKTNIEDIADGFTDSGETDGITPEPEENSVNIGVAGLDTFNPVTTASQTVREAMSLVFEPLFEMDSAMRIVPVLASGYSISADGLTYNITMKNDVVWHDGKKLDAYDAAYTIRCISESSSPYAENLKDVANYSAVSNDTLRIVLKNPVPQFAALLSFPIVKYQSEMTVNPSYIPVGTGPFEFKGKTGIDKYCLSSFGLYHNGKSKIDNVYIYAVPDMEKYRTMFEVSETDIATSTSIDLTTYMPKGKSRLNDFISNRLTFAGFNFRNSVLAGTNTRAGMSLLINKEDIVNTVLYSRGAAVDVPINPGSWLYYDTNNDFRGSREKALALFGNDGWGFNEDGYLERKTNGKKEILKSVILVNSDNEAKFETAKKIKEDFEKCGIKVTLDACTYEKYIRKVTSGDFDIFIGEYDLGINQNIAPLISSSGNYFSYYNTDADVLTAQSGMTQDEENLKEIYRQTGELVRRDVPFVPLYFTKESVLSSGKIKSGIAPSVSAAYRVSNVWSVFE